MIICVCSGVTDWQIRDARCANLEELRATLGVSDCCGICAPYAEEILNEESQGDKNGS